MVESTSIPIDFGDGDDVPTGMEAFCGEPFWTADIFRNETLPLFSQCFQHTILIWIPCLFLFCLSPILIFQITLEKNAPLPWTRLLLTKLIITLLLLIDAFSLLILALYESITADITFTVDFIYPLMLMFLMFLISLFIVACQRFGKVTSGGIFLTWVLLLVCGLPEAYWWLSQNTLPSKLALNGTPRFILYMIWYSLAGRRKS